MAVNRKTQPWDVGRGWEELELWLQNRQMDRKKEAGNGRHLLKRAKMRLGERDTGAHACNPNYLGG
jgi:hypothetical protein